VAATDSASAASPSRETDVTIKPQMAPAMPRYSSHLRLDPAVIRLSDAFGLRSAMRDIGKRIATEGDSVLGSPLPFIVKPGPR